MTLASPHTPEADPLGVVRDLLARGSWLDAHLAAYAAPDEARDVAVDYLKGHETPATRKAYRLQRMAEGLWESSVWGQDYFWQAYPDALLHTFACDCAERVLEHRWDLEGEDHPALWDALGVKRAWLQGNASAEDVEERLGGVDAMLYPLSAAKGLIVLPVWGAMAQCARDAARHAANNLSSYDAHCRCTREDSRLWQIRRLGDLCLEFSEHLERLS